ncbi:putative type I secretion system ATPase [Caenibius tardaugens NBRC 16725]|uniref:Putative type I secretion system ATPase n=1 Tax=Caenibius tardaugens NBRC 16725 TaxID=1219035 RepID=U2ZT07_9SPHN|nr:type I secretion system permease/ATPase [Caenibius tardaugens]GAD48509.1 putative type I secretion system ATPase [Caenibius tardaugens NBRC 16725]
MHDEGLRDGTTPSDPLLACIAELADHFGLAFSPTLLLTLARDDAGRLPFHQAGPALELIGLNFEAVEGRKLTHQPDNCPALIALQGGQVAIAYDMNATDVLIWRPGARERVWLPHAAVAEEFAGGFLSVYGDPSSLREREVPWHSKGRHHWFWSELRKERGAFRPVLLASLLINLLALAMPLFTMNVYDRVFPNRASSTLWVLGVGVLLAFAMEYALRQARTNVIDQIGRRLDLKLSQKIFGRVLATPLSARQGNTGALAARVSEYATVRDFFGSTTIVLIVDAVFLVLFVAVIAFIAGWLAIVPLTAILVMGLIGYRLQARVVEAAQDAQADHGLQQTLLVESIAGMETLKSMAGEGGMTGRWYRLAEIGTYSQQRLRKINATAVSLASTCQQVSNIALVVGGYYLFDAGEITMGAIIAIVMLSSRSLGPAGQLAFLLTRGRQANETLESIERLFDAEDERRQGSQTVPPTVRSASIRLENLEFGYPDAPVAALDGLNLTITPGERIAVIGRVASGKSTLGRLLCGLYQPTDGTMLVDGIDSRQYRPHDIRSEFRFVGQDANLFTGTVKDNLTLGRHDLGDEALIDALRTTGAEQFLSRDAGGFDRLVGEHGRRLSGGQRSFLALARAFVSPSKLLFLDEPTGAMDSQTEKLFVERLSQSLTPGQTLVISTHRPALFSLCDRLIVLDKGRVVADGPKNEIIAATGNAERLMP